MLTLYHSPAVTGEAGQPQGKPEVSFLLTGASTNAKEAQAEESCQQGRKHWVQTLSSVLTLQLCKGGKQ